MTDDERDLIFIYTLALAESLMQIAIEEISAETNIKMVHNKCTAMFMMYMAGCLDKIDKDKPSLYEICKENKWSFANFIDHMMPVYEKLKTRKDKYICNCESHSEAKC